MTQEQQTSPDMIIEQERLEGAINPNYESGLEAEETESDDDVMTAFNANMSTMQSYWAKLYDEMAKDWEMYTLNQWTTQTKLARAKRPMQTVDGLRKFVKAVVAKQYTNPQSIKLDARADDFNTKAKILGEHIRYIESNSGAKFARSNAIEATAVCGIGWYRHALIDDVQYEGQSSLRVEFVVDPLSIMMDPDANIDGTGAMYMVEMHNGPGNVDEDKYTYWWVDEDGRVQWALIDAGKIVERDIWIGTEIPLFPIIGEFSRIRGKISCFGLVRPLTDNQRDINYAVSEAVERLALTPKTPTYVPRGSLSEEGLQELEESAARPVAYIEYDAVDDNNVPIPAPHRADSIPQIDWVVPLLTLFHNNAKEITGIYNTALGDEFGEESGVAIKAREKQGDRGQLVYAEHAQMTLKREGRSLLSCLPDLIGEGGYLPTLSEEGRTAVVRVGQPEIGQDPETGEEISLPPLIENLDPSDLEINVSSGKGYDTRKEEGIETVKALLPILDPVAAARAVPELMLDMDFPSAEKYVEILRPEEQGLDPMVAQQMSEKDLAIEQLQQQVSSLATENEQLGITLQHNTDAKLATERMQQQTTIAKTRMELDYKANQSALDRELKREQMILDYQEKTGSTQQKAQSDLNKIVSDQHKHSEQLAADAESQNKEILVGTRNFQAERIDKLNVNVDNSQV